MTSKQGINIPKKVFVGTSKPNIFFCTFNQSFVLVGLTFECSTLVMTLVLVRLNTDDSLYPTNLFYLCTYCKLGHGTDWLKTHWLRFSCLKNNSEVFICKTFSNNIC
jgi:hypothetical protein